MAGQMKTRISSVEIDRNTLHISYTTELPDQNS